MRKICIRCGSKFGSRADYCPHDGSLLTADQEPPDPLLGTVLLEQFHVEEVIGTGGMGTVYRARQPTVGRDVAIKVLRPELARDEHAVSRFEREGRLAASLDHPNLVRVFLSGRLNDGRLYIVMELLEGRSLADELDHQGVPSIERALVMVMKLCAGLGAVHAAGIVHRDIKPENIYLVRRGADEDFVKLVDFGISRALDPEDTTTTQSGRVFGTAAYISPEAATGEDTDHRSDIYSMGVLTYQLLTGELPFEGKTAGAILMQHVHQEPPALRAKGSGGNVPPPVAQAVMRALRKDPDERPQTLAEFVDSLAEAASQSGLLGDARTLLLGTVWGEELAAPGSFLAELLAASTPPESDDTLPLMVERDPEEEAWLSSAPPPFGTGSHETTETIPVRRRQSWLWASLGVLALILVGVVAGSWWLQRATRAIAADQQPAALETEVAEVPPAPDDAVDVGTDQPPVESLVVAEPVPEEEVAPIEEEVIAPEPEARPKAKPTAKPKTRKRPVKKPRKATSSPRGSAAGPAAAAAPESAPAPEPAPAAEPEPAPAKEAPVEDDGIDWTVPDFPEEPEAPAGETPPADPVEPMPQEPPPPTGTPDAPARNPVVIDEPPA